MLMSISIAGIFKQIEFAGYTIAHNRGEGDNQEERESNL